MNRHTRLIGVSVVVGSLACFSTLFRSASNAHGQQVTRQATWEYAELRLHGTIGTKLDGALPGAGECWWNSPTEHVYTRDGVEGLVKQLAPDERVKVSSILQLVNDFGAQRWELVAFQPLVDNTGSEIKQAWIFKRPGH